MVLGNQPPIAKPSGKIKPWRSKRFLLDIGTACVVALLAAFIFIANEGLWTKQAWELPSGYESDSQQILGWIKAASEGDYHLLDIIYVSRLGAPFGANWNDYPMYEKAFTIFLGWTARSIGLFAAVNLGMLLTHALAAASFYLACRFFRWHRAFSVAGALLFGFTFYLTKRDLGHMLLGLAYTIPWAVFSSWLILGRHNLKRFSRYWLFCLGVSFLMGISNPYYLNLYVQMLILSLTVQWFTHRREENLRTGVLCLLVSLAGFLLIHTGSILFRLYAGANPYAITRAYRESELYALRPIEFFIPPMGHRIGWLSDLGMFYQNETLNQAEVSSPYLGLIGICALIWLSVAFLQKIFRNRNQEIPIAAWQVLWIIAYSVVGGINCLLAIGGIGLFRASGRNSIFISSLILIWLIPQIKRHLKLKSSLQIWSVALAIAALGIFDQLPPSKRTANRADISARLTSDSEFSQKLEAALPPQSAVFQLPIAVFPEGNPVLNMGSYEHLRPYFFTGKLRFSYGMNKGRSDSSWQAETERMPAVEMVKRLETLGFGALYLNRKGFIDNGNSLINSLEKIGYKKRLESNDKELVAILLNPKLQSEAPRTDLFSINHFGNFWLRYDNSPDEVLWISTAYAELQLNPDLFHGKKAHLKANIVVPTDRTVSFLIGNRVLAKKQLQKNIPYLVEFDLDPPTSGKLLRLDTDKPPALFEGGNYAPGTFSLLDIQITPLP